MTETTEAVRQAIRQELLLELIEWAREDARVSGNVDEWAYRTSMSVLNKLEAMAGLPETENVDD